MFINESFEIFDSNPFLTPVRKLTFKNEISKNVLKYHSDSVHEKKKPNKCGLCMYDCLQKNELKNHIQSIHDGENPHKYSFCDITFSIKCN